MIDRRNVLTIAVGKILFVDMAVSLARSFFLWNSDNNIAFYLVTDQPQSIPKDMTGKLHVIAVSPGELGQGFSSKLHLDKLAPEGQTLFIDSDCLIFGELNSLFDRFTGRAVSVVGGYISDGEWFGHIPTILKKFNLLQMPKFNGGIYYLEKGQKATKVYDTARKLEDNYDEIGFVRLRGRPNDEVLMALAMQLHQQKPLEDDGTIMSDPQACPGKYIIDVITGERLLTNPPAPHPQHQAWYPFQNVSPVIFHFLGHYTQHYPYRREIYKLKMHDLGKPTRYTRFLAKVSIEYPERIKMKLTTLFRPLYHFLFGVRKPKISQRL